MAVSNPDTDPMDRQTFEAFVPQVLRRRLAPASDARPVTHDSDAAVLFADIAGFTSLTERLAEHGVGGAEEVKKILDLCFAPLVEIIVEHGGEVLKFAGDAVLAAWWEEPDEDLPATVERAAACGLEIQEQLDGLELGDAGRLKLRVKLGAGRLWDAIVGGVDERWEFLVAGEPLDQIAVVDSRVGEVAVAPPAWNAIAERGVGEITTEGYARLTGLRDAPSPRPVPRSTVPAGEAAGDDHLWAYVPRAVRGRLEAGQDAWLAEFRNVTVMFVNVAGLDYGSAADLERLQEAVRGLQTAIYRFGGSINQILVDDKGTVALAAWGLALHSHEDNASRAMLAALEVKKQLHRLELRGAVGVTTGATFTGLRGGRRRMDFAMIGSGVNLAARLMQAAGDRVLCDRPTRDAARRRLLFEALPNLTVKGRTQPVAVYRPVSEKPRATAGQPRAGQRGIVGRHAELGILREVFHDLEAHGKSHVVVIEGEAGIGKSRLTATVTEFARKSNLRCLLGAGDALERNVGYWPWRDVFRRLLGLDALRDPAARRQRVSELLDPEAPHPHAALLNPVLDLDFAGDDAVTRLTTEARGEITRELLTTLFATATDNAPTLLVLEDVHWMDSPSWTLAAALQEKIERLLMVLVSRPLDEQDRTPECRQLLAASPHRLRLGPLERSEVLTLVCQLLNADSLPARVAQLVLDRTQGHPFFTEELVFALRDRGLLRVEQGECRLSSDADDTEAWRVPDSVQGVVTSRIDGLDPRQQLTLKVASVLGQSFELRVLREVHPIAADRGAVEAQLAAMAEADLVLFDTDSPESTGAFKHAIIREVAYELLPFTERKHLHGAVAEWFEHLPDAEGRTNFPTLAHHWSRTDETAKALHYLEKAGEEALHDDANQEAAGFFRQAIELGPDGDHPAAGGPEALRRARWHRQLGDALSRMWDTPEAFRHQSTALEILGRSIPPSKSRRLGFLFRQGAVQLTHLALPGRFLAETAERRDHFQEASRAVGELAWLNILRQDMLGVFASSVYAVNLAEKANTLSVRPLTLLGRVAGGLKLRRLARRYYDQARQEGYAKQMSREVVDAASQDVSDLLGAGDFERSARHLAEDLETAKSIGYRLGAASLLSLTGAHHRFQGQFEQMREYNLAGLEMIGDLPADELKPWIRIGLAVAEAMLLPPRQSGEHFQTAIRKIEEKVDEDQLLILGHMNSEAATFHVWAGELEAAKRAADVALQRGFENATSLSPILWPEGILEAYLACWEERRAAGADVRELVRVTRRLLRKLRHPAWTYPVWEASLLYYRGRAEHLAGRDDKAQRAWKRSLAAAGKLGLLVEEGRARLALAGLAATESAERAEHLERARILFERSKVPYYLNQVAAS